jgi:hypothetical protein
MWSFGADVISPISHHRRVHRCQPLRDCMKFWLTHNTYEYPGAVNAFISEQADLWVPPHT